MRPNHNHSPEAVCDRYTRVLCAMAERRGVLDAVCDLMCAYNAARDAIRTAEREYNAAKREYSTIWEPSTEDDRKMELAGARLANVHECNDPLLDGYDKAAQLLSDSGMTYTQQYNLLCDLLSW